MVFPQGIPVTMVDGERGEPKRNDGGAAPESDRGDEGVEEVSTRAEAGLSSDAEVLEEQARQGPLAEHADLLRLQVQEIEAAGHRGTFYVAAALLILILNAGDVPAALAQRTIAELSVPVGAPTVC